MRHAVRVTLDTGTNKKATIRRALLVDKESGLLHELATVFVQRAYPQGALNSHRAALLDLAFFFEWCALKVKRSKKEAPWKRPESRAVAGNHVILDREIADFCRWCSSRAERLSAAVAVAPKVVNLPVGEPVDTATANRRMNTTASYLCWVMRECTLTDSEDIDVHFKLDEAARRLKTSFEGHVQAAKKPPPVRSLNESETKAFLEVLDQGLPESTVQERRDKLIALVLYRSGLRAGELLKLWCVDVSDSFEVGDGRLTGCLEVHLRPNDPYDKRRFEPAGKTFPGLVPIRRQVATQLISYIMEDRAHAVSLSEFPESPYIFLSHSGPTKGNPMSQRNLNRIIAKLRKLPGIRSDFTPHVLRHTHLNEAHDAASRTGQDTREVLLQRGRWSSRSDMPSRYAQRSIGKKVGALVALREQHLVKD